MSAERFRYKAFISYSHRDAGIAQWLHRALESYRPPKHLIGRETATGPIQKRLGTIFRDRDELPVAADLTGQINDALADTQFLIVLCSKTSATSKWVNQEVINFKRLKGAGSIIAVIIDGEPFASNHLGQEAEECFVPALRFQVAPNGTLIDQPAEPVAADLRPGKDGKRMVKLKIIAGLLGVGLDELVQREALRRQRFMTAVTFASLFGIGIMGALTFNAIQAREDAEIKRGQAEGLIEFMVETLRTPLKQVGRLKELNEVGQRAQNYYATEDKAKLSDESLGRQARVFHLIGETLLEAKDYPKAAKIFSDTYALTKELLQRESTNTQRLYEHGQSCFWLGRVQFESGQIDGAIKSMAEYAQITDQLSKLQPDNNARRADVARAYISLGGFQLRKGAVTESDISFSRANEIWSEIQQRLPDDDQVRAAVANALSWNADARRLQGKLNDALSLRKRAVDLYEYLYSTGEVDKSSDYELAVAYRKLARNLFESGDIKTAREVNSKAQAIGKALSKHDVANVRWRGEFVASALDAALMDWRRSGHSTFINQDRTIFTMVDDLPNSSSFSVMQQAKVKAKLLLAQAAKIGNPQLPDDAILAIIADLNALYDQTSDPEILVTIAEAFCILGDTSDVNTMAAKDYWAKSIEALHKSGRTSDPATIILKTEIYCRLQDRAELELVQREAERLGIQNTASPVQHKAAC